jgi:hypothetical protein
MLEIFKLSNIDTIKKFIRKVILWAILIIVIQAFVGFISAYIFNRLHLSISTSSLFELIVVGLLNISLVLLMQYFIKQNNYNLTKLIFFMFLTVPPIVTGLLAQAEFKTFLITITKETTTGVSFSTAKLAFSIILATLFSVVGLIPFIVKILVARYGYRTQKNLSTFGYITYRIMIFVALVASILYILKALIGNKSIGELIKQNASLGGLVVAVSALSFVAVLLAIVVFFLVAFDMQKIKQIGSDVIKKQDDKLKCSVILCALVLYIDFFANMMRILIPWGWKKE